MRTFFTIFLLFLCAVCIFSLDVKELNGQYRYTVGPYHQEITFKGNSLSYISKDYNLDEPVLDIIENSQFSLVNIDGIDYLFVEETQERWLILYNYSFLFIYDSEGEPFFKGERSDGNLSLEEISTYRESPFVSDSYLVENIRGEIVEYPTGNLTRKAMIPFPWVEGEDEYGYEVEAKGFLRKSRSSNEYSLYLSNGYVSYDRPDLYMKNSRVKKVKIRNDSTNESEVFILEDCPHFQQLDITSLVNTTQDQIVIIILDVYKGSNYKDTCINMILTHDKRVEY